MPKWAVVPYAPTPPAARRSFYGGGVTGQQDSELPWGNDAAEDLIEQGRGEQGPGWPGRFRWRPRVGKVTAGLVVAALAVGLVGGYLAGHAHGRGRAPAARSPVAPATSLGLAETGSQCSAALGHTLQLGVEVVNGSPEGIRLGQLTAEFPLGGLKLTVASWGPCGTMPYAHPAVSTVLARGASTWITVTVTTLGKCPRGLPVQYVVSYAEKGRTFTVVLPGFADLGDAHVAGCPVP